MPIEPLVAPGESLTPDQRQRYARQIALPQIGDLGQRRLSAARVLMVGAGGLGAPVLLALAAAGVGTIGIIDSDSVEVSNLHRQTIYTMDDIAQPKAVAAAAALRARNPLLTVVAHQLRLSTDTVDDLVAGYDIIVDGTDNFATRHLAHDAAARQRKPYVWGSVLRFDGLVTTFWVDAPNGGTRLADLFPSTPGVDEAETCAVAGVLGSVCATVGAMMASETLKLVVGYGEPLFGRLLVHDGLDATWREVAYGARQSDAPVPAGALDARDTADAMAPAPAATADVDGPATDVDAPADEIDSDELAGLLADREAGTADFVLVDVREPWERDVVAIAGSALVPLAQLLTDRARTVMEPDDRVILYCHHGIRSEYARDVLRDNGWSNVTHLAGGIDDWVLRIEPGKPRY
jgi:molybdopterin/thiamine biosynthesis adenylyltransferase/rhodanese-related sulfurtransferase